MPEPGQGEPRGPLTYADYAALPDDGRQHQLVLGELVVTPSPTRWHQEVVGEVFAKLRALSEERGLGSVLVSPLDVVFDDHTVLQPDVLFVSRARASILGDANVMGAPDLCVEVLSPGSEALDRVRKLDLYARHGVGHYWIFDVAARSIEEYVLAGACYRVRSVTGNDEVFRPALFPGWEFRLAPLGLPA